MKKNIGAITMLLLLLATVNGLYAQKKKSAKGPQPLKDIKSKEIVAEFPCDDRATVFLENILRSVSIRTTHEPKVRLVTTVYYQGEPGYIDEKWLEQLKLGIHGTKDNVVIRSNMQEPVARGVAVLDSSGRWVNKKGDARRTIILYIPASAKLDIDSKYSNISIENNMEEVKLRLTNGSCTLMDVAKLTINGLYGNIYAGNIVNADADIANGRFKAKNILTLVIRSKNSIVEMETVRTIKMHSQADQYEIEEAETVSGVKNYGDLRITALRTSLNITGVNANIKLRVIHPDATLIKIDEQYADLRLPIGPVRNYMVSFEGAKSDVYTPFDKNSAANGSFKVTAGTGKSTSFQVKCSNCTVDFK